MKKSILSMHAINTPCHKSVEAQRLIKLLARNEISTQDALLQVIEMYCPGIDGKARYANGRAIIELLEKQLRHLDPYLPVKNTNDFSKALVDLSQVQYKFKIIQINPPLKAKIIEATMETLLLKCENLLFFNLVGLVKILLDNWCEVGNDQFTFRSLQSLLVAIRPTFNGSLWNRYNLIRTICKVSSEWNKER